MFDVVNYVLNELIVMNNLTHAINIYMIILFINIKINIIFIILS